MSGFPNQTRKLAFEFRNIAGALANPNEITLTIHREHKGVISLQVTVDKAGLQTTGTGLFEYYFTPTAGEGRYYVRVFTSESVGVPTVDEQTHFDVLPPVAA